MADIDRKSLARFRTLVAVANADGRLEANERSMLADALGPHASLLDALLTERCDLDEELALLDTKERRALYQAAFAMAYADGHAAGDEVNVLRKIMPDEGEDSLLAQVLGETRDTLLPSQIAPVADPTARAMEINEDILKYSILSAVAAAVPVPGVAIVADIAVVALQAKMVHDIGLYWGHDMDAKSLWAFVGSVAGSAGTRIALNSLARFVPVWGSAFAATTSFASTFALGKAAEKYFEAGRDLPVADLKSIFESAKKEGGSVYDQEQARIKAARASSGEAIAALNEDLASGRIDRATYDTKLAALSL